MLQEIGWLGPAGWYHVVAFLVIIPYLAVRSRSRMNASANQPPLNRLRHFRSTALVLTLFGAVSILTATRVGINLFNRPATKSFWGGVAGVFMYGVAVAVMSPRWRRAVEKRARIVHLFMPSSGTERAWWIAVSVLAGVSEEITWRGVQPVLLVFLLGSPLAAAVLSAFSFGLAHIIQGWRSVFLISVFALAFQGLVWLSGSLYVAMLVHVAYRHHGRLELRPPRAEVGISIGGSGLGRAGGTGRNLEPGSRGLSSAAECRMMMMETILLTGIPRSGTALACALLNELPDTVALAEPLILDRQGGRARAVADIERFIHETRETALGHGTAISKHVAGSVPDNWVDAPGASGAAQLRRAREEHGVITLGKPLTPGFNLIIKHPAEFTALAELLAPRQPLFAVIRHPLAVLASWQTVNMPVHLGHMPMAEAFTPGLTEQLDAIPDRIDRQVALMAWILSVYRRFPPERILRYEDMIAAPTAQLRRLLPRCPPIERRPERFPIETRYPDVDFRRLAQALLVMADLAGCFYPDFHDSLARYLP